MKDQEKKRMNDSEYLNIMTYGKPTGTINVVPHPEDIIDVDPFVIATMKARINNESLENVYDLSDRAFDEIALMREKNKLKKIFGSKAQLQDAFSSIKSIKLAQEEMNFEEVDRELLSQYSFSISREKNVDEYDFYRSFLFNESLLFKSERGINMGRQHPFTILLEDYRMIHFEPIKITKEAIQMSISLQSLFKDRKLALVFDEFLTAFYKVNP
ncbi:hypothetical protein C0V70_04250 [Bacteriovorax stolpii]|uniref:Uncharacterized protein n=1 Tax=Bacteriovorax stolpii TaxID=960 RepID=A0A2K9NRF6_BACTC|nr:hypothetical protein [Bacteriovorax stolpii]AUN97334.1 hypothetical protein C0V70_04250 [Bacteriovorax stolpii]TDP52506.1 hypothetical protein C8D79_2270 [Bacteriovorax stolpii]